MKFHLFITTLSLVTCAIQTSLAQTVRAEYYALLPFWESPIIPFKGAFPISETEANERIHLKLTFDSNNRTISAEVKIGQHLKAFQGFSNLHINAPLTKVEYPEGKEIHRFFDHYEEPTTVMQGVFEKVYEKDSYGRNTRLIFLDEKGDPASDFFGYVRYEWTYEPDGSILEERFDSDGQPGPLRGDFQFMRTRMVFGHDGFLQLLQNVDEEGALVNSQTGAASYKYYYDEQGRFLRWEVLDHEGQPAIGPSDTSGEQVLNHGLLRMEILFFDKVGEPVRHWSGAQKWLQTYDRFGNKTRRIFQTAGGTPMNGYSGFSETIYEWSTDGRWLLSQRYLDKDGMPANHANSGVSKTEFERDALGRVIKTINYEYTSSGYRIL